MTNLVTTVTSCSSDTFVSFVSLVFKEQIKYTCHILFIAQLSIVRNLYEKLVDNFQLYNMN